MTTTHSGSAHPAPSADALRRLVDAELSPASRLTYVALMLISLLMAVAIGSLLLTEPVLATRTAIAFGLLIVINLAWAAFATWVLARRRTLHGRQHVVAGRMAVTFTSVFVIGAVALFALQGGTAPLVAAAVGGGLLAVAIVVLVRAHRRVALLLQRRETLADQLRSAR